MNKATEIISKKVSPLETGRILTVRERESLEQSLAIHGGIAEATSDYRTGEYAPVIPGGLRINKQKMTQRAREIKAALDAGSPRELNPLERDQAAKEMKEIKDELIKERVLESRSELHVLKRDNPLWHSAMKKAAIRPKWDAKINRYKDLARLLEPDNDMADSLDELRKERD